MPALTCPSLPAPALNINYIYSLLHMLDPIWSMRLILMPELSDMTNLIGKWLTYPIDQSDIHEWVESLQEA